MVFLQAAIGLGILVMIIFGGFIFIGIPIFANIFITILSKKKTNIDRSAKTKIWLKGTFLAILVVSLLLFLIWELFLSRIDLTYS